MTVDRKIEMMALFSKDLTLQSVILIREDMNNNLKCTHSYKL